MPSPGVGDMKRRDFLGLLPTGTIRRLSKLDLATKKAPAYAGAFVST
jgi:hypothetical protein